MDKTRQGMHDDDVSPIPIPHFCCLLACLFGVSWLWSGSIHLLSYLSHQTYGAGVLLYFTLLYFYFTSFPSCPSRNSTNIQIVFKEMALSA